MKKFFLLTLVVVMTLFSAPAYADTIFVSDTFDNAEDLSAWTTSGQVTVINGDLVLGSGVTAGTSTATRNFNIPEGTRWLSVSYHYLFTGSDDYRQGDDTSSMVLTLTDGETTLFSWTSSNGYPGGIFSQTFDTPASGDASFTFTLNEMIIGSPGQVNRLNTDLYIDNLIISGLVPDSRPEPVPEPATLLLLGAGLIGMVAVSRKKTVQKITFPLYFDSQTARTGNGRAVLR
ncbi:PEP-CTERM sorting domain-containing protein [Desulfosarcina sp. OttesenSCG-928-G10]|nr:PEP-CTERM sorting domain-containing protein [Desulfosarcina sp. OttesenSCG-928-G10]